MIDRRTLRHTFVVLYHFGGRGKQLSKRDCLKETAYLKFTNYPFTNKFENKLVFTPILESLSS